MHFELSEEQQLVRQTARDFATKRLLPNAARRDVDGTFPAEELGEL
ncbi:MAG: acyl-CoA dehydrogenase family protein, partial [Deltaproteobacteria bacterium]|nr:acyl-CoA dehydrogenase family protein [Deltaproteobacteria bacterium]